MLIQVALWTWLVLFYVLGLPRIGSNYFRLMRKISRHETRDFEYYIIGGLFTAAGTALMPLHMPPTTRLLLIALALSLDFTVWVFLWVLLFDRARLNNGQPPGGDR